MGVGMCLLDIGHRKIPTDKMREPERYLVNAKTKKRLAIVTGIIVIVMAVILAMVGSGSSAKTVSVAQAASGNYANQRVQVSGNVVENSYSTTGNVLTFSIYDPEDSSAPRLQVNYDGGVAATFGNDVTAICTGKMGTDGVLACSELVTKCPSKYESGTEALTVSRMLDYGDSITDKTLKVTGTVKSGSQTAAGTATDRFVLVDASDATKTVSVTYDGALSSETTADGATVVLTGHMGSDGKFAATDVALEG